MTWWKKIGLIFLGVIVIEVTERTIDYMWGDGDGNILAYHL